MDLIRKYLTQIKAQLAGLTISQKLLIGLLVVVMAATVFFTVMFSAKPAMVPLIAQAMSPEEINRVEMSIKGKHAYQVLGDKILVPMEEAYSIRGELAAEQALPKDLSTAFAAVATDANPFVTDSQRERQWNNALQEELTRYLRSFPYVDGGSVIIARGQRVGLGTPALPSTATVNVRIKGGDSLTGNQVLAIVEMVSGAVPGMKREDVHVVDGQRAYHAPSSNSPMPASMLEYKKMLEDDLTRKLFAMFDGMGDVKIAVNIVPDFSDRRIDDVHLDPKNVIQKTVSESQRESNTNDGGVTQGQPGVPSNVGMSVSDTGTSGKGAGSTSTESKTENRVEVGSTHTQTSVPPGVEIKEMTASLSLPRSYFVSLYRRMTRDPKADPEDEKLQPVIDQQIKAAQARAKNTIGAKTDDQIRVDWYDDTVIPRGMELAASLGGGGHSALPGMVAQYAKQGVLAVVALGALGMMLMMVKRAVPSGDDGDIDTGAFFGGGGKGGGGSGKKRKVGAVDQLDASDDVFGEANEGEAVLTGIELDDDTLQSRKMVDEVSTMIKENPENAAALVKRWMGKSK